MLALTLSECQVYVVPGPGPARAARPRRTGACAAYPASVSDRYGSDVLSGDWKVPPRGRSREVEAETGLVVEDVETGWCGAVVRVEKAGGMRVVHLEDRRGRTKGFPMGPGFLLDGAPVVLTPPTAAARAQLAEARAAASRTASGSRAVEGARARVASGSRIFVEGRHDAELVEKVWGADLRVEGVVVELLDGVDDLVGGDRRVPARAGAPDGRARRPPAARHQGAPRRRRPPPRAGMPRTCGCWATRTSTCGRACAPSGSG